MKSLYNPDSPVMQFLTKVADLMILNVVYLVFCIPIFTIGAATTALYRVMLNYEKDETANPARQFWRAFRANLKPATILFLIMLIPIAFMIYYFMVIVGAAYSGSKTFVIICCVAVLLIMMLWSFLWPMQAQFENSIGNTIKNALLLSVGHFPIAVLMSAINLFPLLLLSFFPDVFLRISMLWILFGFALIAKINTKMILKVFKPFLQAADAEDTEIADE